MMGGELILLQRCPHCGSVGFYSFNQLCQNHCQNGHLGRFSDLGSTAVLWHWFPRSLGPSSANHSGCLAICLRCLG